MRFLLIAPAVEIRTEIHSPAVSLVDGSMLRSRSDSDPVELRQETTDLNGPESFAFKGYEITVHRAQKRKCGRLLMIVMIVEFDLLEGQQVEETENLLSDILSNYANSCNAEFGDFRWVQRIALLDVENPIPVGWLHNEQEKVDIQGSPGMSTLVVGWANVAIENSHNMRSDQLPLIIDGLVDAQALWCGIVDISNVSAQATRNSWGPTRVKPSEVERFLHVIEGLYLDLSRQNLAYDEHLTVIQGIRCDSCGAALRMWKYEQLMERVTNRLGLLETLALKKKEALDQRYKRAVESTLLLLTMTTIIGLGLGLIQTAYSGGVSEVPGDYSRIPVFDVIRWINADYIFLIPLALFLIGWIMLRRVRR